MPKPIQRERLGGGLRGRSLGAQLAYGHWRDVALERADLIVGLDYPRWVSLGRLTRRTVVRLVLRTRICNGNVETLRGLFSPGGIIGWHFKSFGRKHDRMRAWHADPAMPETLLLRSPADAERWLTAF